MSISWAVQTLSNQYPLSGIGYVGNFSPLLMYSSGSYRYYNIHFTGNTQRSERFTFTGDALSSNGWISSLPTTDRLTLQSTKLLDGRVFLGGGYATGGGQLYGTWLGTYDSGADTFSWVASTSFPGSTVHVGEDLCHTLSDGRILALTEYAGGYSHFGTVSGNTITWVAATGWSSATGNYSSATILPDGRILAATYAGQYYLGTISGNAITWVTATLVGVTHGFSDARLRTLSSGKVLVYGDAAASPTPAADNFQLIEVSGDTLTFSILGTSPASKSTYSSLYGAWELPSGKIAALFGGATNDALFVGSTSIQFEAALSSVSTITANFASPSTPFEAALASQSTLTATLTDYAPTPTVVRFRADLYSESTLSASLSTQKRFAAALSSESTLSATLQTGALLAANLASSSTVTANLSAPVIFRVDLESQSSLSADLSTQVRFAANLISRSDVSAFLSIPGKQKGDEVFVYTSNSDLAVKVRRYG